MRKLKQILANSCLFGHKWGEWAQYQQGVITWGKQESFDIRQRRCCVKCNKMEDKWVA